MQEQFFNFLNHFGNIPEKDRELIVSFLSYEEIKEGIHLVEPGMFSNVLYFICEGIMKISILNEKGSFVTYYFLNENHLSTILRNFKEDTRSEVYLSTVTDTKLISITKQDIVKLYDRLPYFKEIMDKVFQEMMLRKINTRNAYLGSDATQRYATFLTTQPDIALRIPLSDVASYLGITQQSLSRIRKNK